MSYSPFERDSTPSKKKFEKKIVSQQIVSQQIVVQQIVSQQILRDVRTTGRRRRIGCLISCITFRKLTTNNRDLLRKMTYKDIASYESLTPCSVCR